MKKKLSELPRAERVEIDLSGLKGRKFYLLGLTNKLCNRYKLDRTIVKKEMTSGDYENLLQVFDKYFGEIITLHR